MAGNLEYYLRYIFLVLLLGYHLMELDMIKIAFPGFLEEFGVISKDNKKESLSKFADLYSISLYLGIPSTLIWGWASDKFGSFKSSLVQLVLHILVTILIAYTQTYDHYAKLSIALSFFSCYTISLSTFMGWLPQDRKQSFVARSQFFSSSMLQLAPMVAGILLQLSGTDVIYKYHMFLALLLSVLTLGYAFAFRNYTEDAKQVGKKEETESEEMKGIKGFLVILKNKSACSLLLFGIYLRLVKKLVDVAVHLWAEIGVNENGLGFDKVTLGNYSSFGGMLSVVLYLYFSTDDITQLPAQLKSNLLLCAVSILCFPFLALAPSHHILGAGLAVLILIFNFCFSALFSVWIGLLNNGVKKEIRSKSFALTLAIRNIIGSYVSNKCFELLKWSLSATSVTEILGGRMNSAVFFWMFALVNISMYLYFRNLKVEKKEKEWELVF